MFGWKINHIYILHINLFFQMMFGVAKLVMSKKSVEKIKLLGKNKELL
jgi:hypothetical protein